MPADLIGASTLSPRKQELRSDIIRGAQSGVDLLQKAQASDPQLAASLTEKSLAGSKTVWFPPISFAVIWAASHYGIAMDPETSTMISGLVSWLVLVGCRYVSRSSIGSVLPTAAKT